MEESAERGGQLGYWIVLAGVALFVIGTLVPFGKARLPPGFQMQSGFVDLFSHESPSTFHTALGSYSGVHSVAAFVGLYGGIAIVAIIAGLGIRDPNSRRFVPWLVAAAGVWGITLLGHLIADWGTVEAGAGAWAELASVVVVAAGVAIALRRPR